MLWARDPANVVLCVEGLACQAFLEGEELCVRGKSERCAEEEETNE